MKWIGHGLRGQAFCFQFSIIRWNKTTHLYALRAICSVFKQFLLGKKPEKIQYRNMEVAENQDLVGALIIGGALQFWNDFSTEYE